MDTTARGCSCIASIHVALASYIQQSKGTAVNGTVNVGRLQMTCRATEPWSSAPLRYTVCFFVYSKRINIERVTFENCTKFQESLFHEVPKNTSAKCEVDQMWDMCEEQRDSLR